MNASWMIGSAITSICFACAAMALESVGALYRRMPLRWVWVGALAASLAFMGVGLLPRTVATVVPVMPMSALGAEGRGVPAAAPSVKSAVKAPLAPVPAKPVKIELPPVPPGAERVVFVAWDTASAILALLLFVARWRLREERSEWTRGRIAGTRLLISTDFGPAIVGVVDPEIVVPRWVAELDEPARVAIVAHEAEHLRARDPMLLLAGLVTVVLLPWNPGLWLCWRGLRRTIELDCDARVLARGMERTDYANVLLGAWQRARSSWLPSPAFAERASGLGKRVEHLMRPEPRRRTMRTLAGVGAAATFVVIASVTPAAGQGGKSAAPDGPYPLVFIDGVKRPDLPPRYRYTGAVVPETTTTPEFKITYKGPIAVDSAADKLYPSRENLSLMQTISAPASVAHFGQEAKYGAVLYYTKQYRNAGGSILYAREGSHAAPMMDPGTPPDVQAQRIVDRMFVTIPLTAAQKAAAFALAAKYVAAQRALPHGPLLATWPRIVQITDERDEAMRALLTRKEDLEIFDVHAMEGKPHGVVTPDAVADNMYINLFVYDTITLTKIAQVRAHEIIRHALIEERALYDRAPNDFEGRVAIRRTRDADLRALLTSDRDRAKFDVRAERTMRGELQPPSKPKTL
jgi:beta-lactamase regulating signal transducer with metallopeptidase domain